MTQYDIIAFTHGGCMDGMASAWALQQYHKDKSIRYVFGMSRNLLKDLEKSGWGTNPPLQLEDLRNKDVYILDYMYSREEILSMGFRTLKVIDHHTSNESLFKECGDIPNMTIVYDNTLCAAVLTWQHLVGHEVPWWLEYVQDRDLFTFKLPNSREINNAFYRLKYRTFEQFDKLCTFTEEQKQELAEQGKVITVEKNSVLEDIAKRSCLCTFDGYRVCVVEANIMVSDVAEYLYRKHSEECDFIMCVSYHFLLRGFKCRLRVGKTSTLNLGDIAAKYGGGGQQHAASFLCTGNIFERLTY